MRTFSLQSGSNGNAIYVEADGVSLLIDAGLSGVQAEKRLAGRGGDIRRVDALLISHDHADHIRCAGIYQRKFGLPIYVTQPTLAAASCKLGCLTDVRSFEAGQTLDFGSVRVHTIPTPHDAVDGVAFVLESAGKRLGVFTDLGRPFPELARWLGEVDAAYLESNYDVRMLEEGPYPEFLKERIRGPHGHLSNVEAAELVVQCGAVRRLRWLALAHMSEDNNTPTTALATHRRILGRKTPLQLAGRYEPSPLLSL